MDVDEIEIATGPHNPPKTRLAADDDALTVVLYSVDERDPGVELRPNTSIDL